MGFLVTGETEMQVYLTEYGKRMILAQTFRPAKFTINDSDVNYLTNQVMDKSVADISGDYDDNIFALSEFRNIRESIIRKISSDGSKPIAIVGATTSVAVGNNQATN